MWCLKKIFYEIFGLRLFYIFIIGGVGIGKSWFIKVINFEVLCLFFRFSLFLDVLLVLLIVFIGIVFFNIGGFIIYSVFLLIKYLLLLYELLKE